ncbi:MAG TPA: FHA domain-containing protein [Bryobacteraceae bacterium]
MKPLDKLEQMLGSVFRKIPAGGQQAWEPIEIRRAVLHEIMEHVQPKGGGEYVFLFAEVAVEIFARDAAEQQIFEASLDATELTTELRSQLGERACRADNVTILIDVIQIEVNQDDAPFRIEYRRKRLEQPVTRPPAYLIVLQGSAAEMELAIDRDLIYLGRLSEVKNKAGGLERRNDLAFADTETTVSRKHAWLRYDPAEGKFRAYNDPACSLGTQVFRDGRIIVCDSTRGVQLRSGDELHLGEARIRFEMDTTGR